MRAWVRSNKRGGPRTRPDLNGLPPSPVADERALGAALRRAGFEYDPRRRRISRTGRRDLALPYTYLGADDKTGLNYTSQPAVHSYYKPR